MTPSVSPKRGGLTAVIALLVLVGVAAVPAIAASSSKKFYTATIDPTSTAAGTTQSYTVTLHNSSTGGGTLQSFGSANVTIPNGLSVNGSTVSVDTNVTGAHWYATLNGSTIELRSDQPSSNSIPPGKDVFLHFDATVGCPEVPNGDPSRKLQLTTKVKQSNDFNGTNNDFTLLKNTQDPAVTITGFCIGAPDSVSFEGTLPSPVTAGGSLGDVTVVVQDSNGTGVPGVTVSLTSGGLSSNPGDQVTDDNGQTTFTGLNAGTTPGDYSLTATAGGISSDANFTVTAGEPASISFTTQPTNTQTGETIGGASGVTVHVTDGFDNPVGGATVAMTIGADPTGEATLTGTTSVDTDASGDASFTDLSIATTSSGYALKATSGTDQLSDPFAITNSDPNGCTDPDFTGDCTATFDDGHTVSAPTGTTLIIETNQSLCSAPALENAIAGTVTIIPPTGAGPYPIQFDDDITFPIDGYYPFCKTSTANPGGADVPLCPNASGEPAAANIPCVQQAISAVAPNPPTLHSVMWITNVDPIGRH